nr:unnamed protein product [Callosobruchus chinensis]
MGSQRTLPWCRIPQISIKLSFCYHLLTIMPVQTQRPTSLILLLIIPAQRVVLTPWMKNVANLVAVVEHNAGLWLYSLGYLISVWQMRTYFMNPIGVLNTCSAQNLWKN